MHEINTFIIKGSIVDNLKLGIYFFTDLFNNMIANITDILVANEIPKMPIYFASIMLKTAFIATDKIFAIIGNFVSW